MRHLYMRKILITVFISIALVIGVNAQKINQQESKAEFKIGNLGLSSTKGEIKGMQGSVAFDKTNLTASKFNVTISPKTVNTENEKRDEHIQNEDFFNVDKYLTIRFVSTSIVKFEGDYIAKGKLTILKTTKEIELPFRVTTNGDKTIFVGEIEVNRFDYGLASESYKSTFMVGEIAEVKITCVVE